jgi:POT family proton-dependent oligopeptide transporter
MAGLEKNEPATGSIPASDLKKVDSTMDESDLDSSPHYELDGIHDGLQFPTEHERQTLRRVADTIPWNAYRESTISSRTHPKSATLVIAIVELAERFSFYGSSVVFVCHHRFFNGLGAHRFLD